jgi:hypothetical protein
MATAIAATIEQWRGQLLDNSKRNRLINLSLLDRRGLARPAAGRVWATLFSEEDTMGMPGGASSSAKYGDQLGPPGPGLEVGKDRAQSARMIWTGAHDRHPWDG